MPPTDLIVAFDKEYQLAYFNQSFKKNFEMFAKEFWMKINHWITYIGLSRFIEIKSNWEDWIIKAFAGEHFKDKIEYKIIGKKIFIHFRIQTGYSKIMKLLMFKFLHEKKH